MLWQRERLPTLCQEHSKYMTEEGSEPRASVCMEMSGFHPGSQVLLDTGGLEETSAERNSMGAGGKSDIGLLF